MKNLIVVSALILAGCSDATERQHQLLMQDIEQRVQLPEHAKKLHNYARYYATDGGHVIGVYTTDFDQQNRYYDLPIGQRRWIEQARDLPSISDGGCTVVHIDYNPENRGTPHAFCNGRA